MSRCGASPPSRAGRRGARLTALLVGLGALAGCAEAPDAAATPPAERFPAGTVLAVGGQVLSAAELEATARGVGALFPGEVERAHRRRALKSTLLPRLAVAAVHSEARERALRQAGQRLLELRSAPERAEELAVEVGNWKELDLEVWAAAQDALRAAGIDDFAAPDAVLPLAAQPGAWFGPVEVLGEFVLARVEDTRPGRTPGDLILELRAQRFGYLPDDFDVHDLREAYAESELVVVDPEVGDLVSGFYLQQLGQ